MDQQISIKKFFNYCFSNAHFKTKSKENEKSECGQYTPGNKKKDSELELKTKTTKNSPFHKFLSKNDSTSKQKKKFTNNNYFNNDDEATSTKPPLSDKQIEKKYFLSCFKKNSSGDEAMSRVEKLPILVTKLDLDSTVQRKENSIVREAVPRPKCSRSQEFGTEPSMRYSHNSAIELMSKDGTLQLYSADTLTPLSSSAIQDEERIQTHLSVSCFRPENYDQYSSSEGPDDVFEAYDETSTNLALNVLNSNLEYPKRVSENRSSRIHQIKKSHMTHNKESEYLVKNLIPTPNLFSNGGEEKIRICPQKKSMNKTSPVPNHCPCLETANAFSSISDVKKHFFNHPRPPTLEETHQIASNVPLTITSCQKQYHAAHSVHSCTSSHSLGEVSPVKKWILQMYFNSLVAEDQNSCSGYESINNNIYTKENKTENSSPLFAYVQQNDSRAFNQTAVGQNSLGTASARISEINSNFISQKCRSRIQPVRNAKSCSMKSENERLEMERRSSKTLTLGKSKKSNDHYCTEKENKFNRTRIKSVPTTARSRNGTRCAFRDKYRNSKPVVFSQDATYTHYPFIDGPLAENSGKLLPTSDAWPNYESWIRTVTPGDHLV